MKKKLLQESGSPRLARVDLYLLTPFQIMWRNFLAGTFNGLGFLLGSALFLTLLGWVLNSVVGEIPFFSDFSQAINVWLHSTLENKP